MKNIRHRAVTATFKNSGVPLLVLVFLAGAAIGYSGAGYQYSVRIEKAKQFFPALPTLPAVSGAIQSISGSTITLLVQSVLNPFEDLPTVREVTVMSTTKIVKSEPKDPQMLMAETAEYQKVLDRTLLLQDNSAPVPANLLAPPQPFSETAIRLSDLKVGDMITVDAGKDIKTATRFEAVKITLVTTLPAPSGVNLPNTGSVPPAGSAPASSAPSSALY